MAADKYLSRAMHLDPSFAMPLAWAARWRSLLVGQRWSTAPADDAKLALDLASRAIDLDRQNSLALATYGHLKSYLFHDYDPGSLPRPRPVGVPQQRPSLDPVERYVELYR